MQEFIEISAVECKQKGKKQQLKLANASFANIYICMYIERSGMRREGE
jgi:hypothetical protein